MLSFLPRELFVKPPQITFILAIGPWGRGVMHLITPSGGKVLRRASVCLCKAETSSYFLDKASSLTCRAVKLSSRICLGIQRRSLPECIHFTASGVTFTLMTFLFTTFSALSARYWGSFRATGKQNTRYSVSGIQDGDQKGPW